MKKNKDTRQKEAVARQLLADHGLSLLDAALIIRELCQNLPGGRFSAQDVRTLISLGKKETERRSATVCFRRAWEETIQNKQNRRPRTISEIRYIGRKFMKSIPWLAERGIRTIRASDCHKMIHRAFSTPRQRYKARLILSGIFSVSMQRGWCDENPARSKSLNIPPPAEKEIRILSVDEILRLKKTALRLFSGVCLVPMGLMLYCGIRPSEVERLKWGMIDWDDRAILIPPEHSKTGGARQVSIPDVMFEILLPLKSYGVCSASSCVCPPNWRKKWRIVRRMCGWSIDNGKPWIQDILRHTFASYHLKMYRNYADLQYEMGHGSLSLLRTRYINLAGLSRREAKLFWKSKPCQKD